MTIKQITSVPPDIHAWYADGKEVFSEPVLVFALITGRGKKSVVRPMVMGENPGSDKLVYPEDKDGFLGVGSSKDQKFWAEMASK